MLKASWALRASKAADDAAARAAHAWTGTARLDAENAALALDHHVVEPELGLVLRAQERKHGLDLRAAAQERGRVGLRVAADEPSPCGRPAQARAPRSQPWWTCRCRPCRRSQGRSSGAGKGACGRSRRKPCQASVSRAWACGWSSRWSVGSCFAPASRRIGPAVGCLSAACWHEGKGYSRTWRPWASFFMMRSCSRFQSFLLWSARFSYSRMPRASATVTLTRPRVKCRSSGTSV